MEGGFLTTGLPGKSPGSLFWPSDLSVDPRLESSLTTCGWQGKTGAQEPVPLHLCVSALGNYVTSLCKMGLITAPTSRACSQVRQVHICTGLRTEHPINVNSFFFPLPFSLMADDRSVGWINSLGASIWLRDTRSEVRVAPCGSVSPRCHPHLLLSPLLL